MEEPTEQRHAVRRCGPFMNRRMTRLNVRGGPAAPWLLWRSGQQPTNEALRFLRVRRRDLSRLPRENIHRLLQLQLGGVLIVIVDRQNHWSFRLDHDWLGRTISSAVAKPLDGVTNLIVPPYSARTPRVIGSPSPIPWPNTASTCAVDDSKGRNHR